MVQEFLDALSADDLKDFQSEAIKKAAAPFMRERVLNGQDPGGVYLNAILKAHALRLMDHPSERTA